MSDICYAHEANPYGLSVTYLVLKTGVRLTRSFESPYLARAFVNKLRHSKECKFVASSGF